MKKTIATSMLILAMSVTVLAQTSITGGWYIADRVDEMGTRLLVAALNGVVIGEESKTARLLLQQDTQDPRKEWYFCVSLSVAADPSPNIEIRFDQEEKQPYSWRMDRGVGVMGNEVLLRRRKMAAATTFRLQYQNMSGSYTILRFDVRGFQATLEKMRAKIDEGFLAWVKERPMSISCSADRSWQR